MNYRDQGNHDLFLEYDGTIVPLRLRRDQNGAVAWYPTVAPMSQEQFKTGDYGYENTPSEVDVPLSYQDLSIGAGFVDDANESPTAGPRSYSHSRGVDLSERGRMYLSPLRVADSGGSGAAIAPVKFIVSSKGVHRLAGRYIDELTSAPGTWTNRADAGVGNVFYDIIEYKGYLFATRGNGGSYMYSSDGITWTAYSDATVNALYWATRDDVLWYVDSSSRVANNQSGTAINGGTAWSATDNVGHSGETVRGLLEIDNELYVFKEEGIYRYTGSVTEDVWLGGKNMRRTTNGFMPYFWHDQKTYVPFGDRLMQFDHTVPSVRAVFPTQDMRGHPEVNGQIAAVWGDERWLYVAVYNAAGDTYIMKGNPYHNNGAGEWHTYLFLSQVQCQAGIVVGPGVSVGPSSTNPAIILGYGAATSHYILPRTGWRPEDDANFAFDSSGGTVWGSYTAFGVHAFPKFLNGGKVVGRNLSSTEVMRLSYEIDESGVPVTIVSGTATGVTDGKIVTTVEFQRVRPIVRLSTGSSAESPVGVAATLHATPNPPRRHKWTFMVDVADSAELLGGGQSPLAAREIESFLFGSLVKRVTMTDVRGRSFIIKVNTVAGVGPGGEGADASG